MNKKEFTYHHYYIKMLVATPMIVIAGPVISSYLVDYFGLETLIPIVSFIMMTLLSSIYFAVTKKLHMFEKKGSYYTKGKTLYLEYKNEIIEIKKASKVEIEYRSFPYNKYAILSFVTNNKEYIIFSEPVDGEKIIENSSLYPIYKMLKNNKF